MGTELFIKAIEIAKVMGKSKSYGYKVVRELNKELEDKGFMIVEGETNRQYFYERFYGMLYERGMKKMAAYQNEKNGTWYIKCYYKDWQGVNRPHTKRGFKKKSDAINYGINSYMIL